jgi:hypothetical protein
MKKNTTTELKELAAEVLALAESKARAHESTRRAREYFSDGIRYESSGSSYDRGWAETAYGSAWASASVALRAYGIGVAPLPREDGSWTY